MCTLSLSGGMDSHSYLMGGDLIADDSVMGRGRCQLITTRTDPNPLGLVTLNPQHQPPGPSPIGLVIHNTQLVGRRPHLNDLLMGCGRCLLIFSTSLA
jgi:hypothetical protein